MVTSCLMLLSFSSLYCIHAIIHETPYAIGFFFADETLPESTCITELQTVYDATYPIYKQDITTDSTLQTSDISAIEAYYAESYSTNTGGGGTENNNIRKRRQLVQQQQQRQLSNNPGCYPLCSSRPRLWLIINGCREECGLRRNLQEVDNTHRNTQATSGNMESSLLISDPYYTKMGNTSHILTGQGDYSATTFYWKVQTLIPESNPCRNLMLGMKYQRIPLSIDI